MNLIGKLQKWMIPWIVTIFPICVLRWIELLTGRELRGTHAKTIAWLLSLGQCAIITYILWLKFKIPPGPYFIFWVITIWYLVGGNTLAKVFKAAFK